MTRQNNNNVPDDHILNAVKVLERRDLQSTTAVDISNKKGNFGSGKTTGHQFQFIRIKSISRSLPENKFDVERYMMEDVLSGIHGLKVPFVYLIIGTKFTINVFLGILNNSATPVSHKYTDILSSSLQGTFPDIELQHLSNDEVDTNIINFINGCHHYGIMTGIPTPKFGIETNGVEQIERLIRGLYRHDFGYMVIADPAGEFDVISSFDDIAALIRENSSLIKETSQYTRTSRMTLGGESLNRSVQYYVELLENLLEKLKLAKSQGMWRVMSYFFSPDSATMGKMSNLLKTVFSGEHSVPEAIRTLELKGSNPASLLSTFRQLELDLNFHPAFSAEHPLRKILKHNYVSALTSRDLATFVHLPKVEMPGYDVKDTARFGVCMPEVQKTNQIHIGEILDRGTGTGNNFTLPMKDLVKHGLIAGVTGSGKSNTCLYILKQLWTNTPKIPFLVIEPAKAEYRSLMNFQGFEDLQIFTLGNETTSPFRLNPFEVMQGVKLQTHIDYLKAVFNASFVMYAPMPYVLERCIHEIYEDKGWDLTANNNIFFEVDDEPKRDFFPTLTHLYNKIDSVVDSMGYEDRLTMDIKAGLKARLGSLRIGGKGSMLDTTQSIPMNVLLQSPTILELQNMGDDEEKAFVIGLLVAKLYEYREVVSKETGNKGILEHVTLIEEAHRLLTKTSSDSSNLESVNTKAIAVETFCNILSEIRAFGEGILIAEQIPSKLAQDAVKNTNLKIMHRVVARDDRDLMGHTMNLNEEQNKYVALLEQGEATVFSEGFSEPFLIRIPHFPSSCKRVAQKKNTIFDKDVARFMIRKIIAHDSVYGRHNGCTQCQHKCLYRDAALSFLAKKEPMKLFTKYLYAILENSINLATKYPHIKEALCNERPLAQEKELNDLSFCYLISGGELLLSQKSSQHNLKPVAASELLTSYYDVINSFFSIPIKTQISDTTKNYVKFFEEKFKKSFNIEKGPFPGCDEFCKAKCYFRYDLKSHLQDIQIDNSIRDAIKSGSNEEKKVKKICKDIARDFTFDTYSEFTESIVLCFFIQKTIQMSVKNIVLNVRKWIVDVEEV